MIVRVFLVFCALVGLGDATCPWNETGLVSFAGDHSPITPSSDIQITTRTLLDINVVHVNTIDISGNGALVLEPGSEVNITTREIRIRGNGALIIGDTNCRFTTPVNIKLYGNRTTNRTGLSERGEKYISLEENATLSIFGEEKRPFTKLTSTVMPSVLDYRLQSDPTWNSYNLNQEGFAAIVFDETNHTVLGYEVYDLDKNFNQAAAQVVNMNSSLNSLPDGRIVCFAVQNYLRFPTGLDLTSLYDNIETRAGMPANDLALRNSAENDSFAMCFEAVSDGATGNFDQTVDEHTAVTEAWASIEVNGKKVTAISKITPGSKGGSNVDFLVSSLTEGYKVINVAHDVDSEWDIGDSIVLASTDFAMSHAEVRKIKSFPTADSIQLDHEVIYRHFGEIENNVDMRGEVALLSRKIKIFAELTPLKACPEENGNCDQFNYDTYGCHIKVLRSFDYFHLEGVELFFAGQPIDKGFYSVHFHMCEDVTNKEAVVKHNSIHNAFRAVAIHGTYGTSETQLGVEVIGNVAYEILGHTYFLEDGAERANSFEGNFGASTRKVVNSFFSSDADKPSIFWIVSPETVMKDNVAAGSEVLLLYKCDLSRLKGLYPNTKNPNFDKLFRLGTGKPDTVFENEGKHTGIWYLFPNTPVGLSASLGVYAPGQALKTPLFTNDNNVMHSCDRNGLFFDHTFLNDDGDTDGGMKYDPRVDPLNPNSDKVQVCLYRNTAYKNRILGIWLRGGGLCLLQASIAESRRGAQFASGGPQHQYMYKSVILGETVGNNEYATGYPDAYGREKNGLQSFNHYLGFVFYDGPVYIRDSFFCGFEPKPNNELAMGALGFKPKNKASSSPVSTATGLRFCKSDPAEMNWVYDGNPAEDGTNGFGNENGDEVATFRYAEKPAGDCEGPDIGPYQVFKPEHFLRTEHSYYRENWKMMWSLELYGKFFVNVQSAPSGFDPAAEMERVDTRNTSDLRYENSPLTENKGFMVVLGRTDDFYYNLQFENGFPNKFFVDGQGVALNQDAMLGICMPPGTTTSDFRVQISRPNGISFDSSDNSIQWVSSLDEVRQDVTMSRLFLDGRYLYGKFLNDLVRDSAWDAFDDDNCPGGSCPRITITMNSQTTSYTKCFFPTEAQLNVDISIGETNNCTLNAGTRESDWGAGNTLSDRDGGWREWSSWAECCNSDPGNPIQTTRTRKCTFPIPYGNGANCTGDSTETKDCEIACPVEGTWSTWGEWGTCGCTGGVSTRDRTRTCDGVANGGAYCQGTNTEAEPCSGGCSEVDGQWAAWSIWSACSCPAGSSGAMTRTRNCEGIANGGDYCTGASSETETCNNNC